MGDDKYILKSEDWMALFIGLFLFSITLAQLAGTDLLGWVAKINVWTDISKSVTPISKNVALSGFVSMLLTYLFFLVIITIGAALLGRNLGKFILGFTFVFWISYI